MVDILAPTALIRASLSDTSQTAEPNSGYIDSMMIVMKAAMKIMKMKKKRHMHGRLRPLVRVLLAVGIAAAAVASIGTILFGKKTAK